MELKLHHVNYSTKDVGAVAEFYRSLFNMKPVPSYGDAQITSQGYDRKVEFLTDGTTEFHIAPQDLGVAFRTKQSSQSTRSRSHCVSYRRYRGIQGHAKREKYSIRRLRRLGHRWLVSDLPAGSDGTIVEVHQTDYKEPGV